MFENTETEIYFSYRLNNGYQFLSTFYRSPMFIDGKFYHNIESYFQSEKWADKSDRIDIGRMPYGKWAYKRGKVMENSEYSDGEKVKGWDRKLKGKPYPLKMLTMIKACRYKFAQNPELAKKLMATENAKLIYANPSDMYWGIGNGKGKNILGNILMSIRKTLRIINCLDPIEFTCVNYSKSYDKAKAEFDEFMSTEEGKEAMWCFNHGRYYYDIEYFKQFNFKQTPEELMAEHRQHKQKYYHEKKKRPHKRGKVWDDNNQSWINTKVDNPKLKKLVKNSVRID